MRSQFYANIANMSAIVKALTLDVEDSMKYLHSTVYLKNKQCKKYNRNSLYLVTSLGEMTFMKTKHLHAHRYGETRYLSSTDYNSCSFSYRNGLLLFEEFFLRSMYFSLILIAIPHRINKKSNSRLSDA